MLRRAMLCFVTTMLWTAASAETGAKRPEDVVVLYSLSLERDDFLKLSIYNPSSYPVCTSFDNWPGPAMGSDDLRVVGADGQKWEYIGLDAATVGRARDLRIEAQSEVTTTVDIRKNYKPASADHRIGKIYYGTWFSRC